MKIILMFVFLLAVIGCGKTKVGAGTGGASRGNGSNATGSQNNRQWQDLTKNQCGTRNFHAGNALGSWSRQVATTQGATQNMLLTVTNNSITLTNSCSFIGANYSVSTGAVPATFSTGQVNIQGTSHKGGGNCAANLNQGIATYQLVDNCLLINLGSQAQYFVHVTN